MGVDVEYGMVASAGWRELLDRLRLDAERIADRLLVRLGELPSYRALPDDEGRAAVLTGVRALLDALHDTATTPAHRNGTHPEAGPGRDGHLPLTHRTPARLHEDARALRALFHRLGESLARQGVTAGDLAQSWHIACEEIARRAREVLPAGPGADAVLLQLYGLVLGRLDGFLAATAEGHRSAELERARRDQSARAGLVRAVFSGRLSPAGLDRRAEMFRLDRAARYHAVRARPCAGTDAAALERYLTGGLTDGLTDGAEPSRRRPGVLALVDDDLCGFLERLPSEPAPAPVGVGGPVRLEDLPEAFRAATRALEAAVVLGRTGPVDVASLGVEAAVVADDAVGQSLLARFVRPLADLGAPGELILDTVARYLANDSRLDATARQLHVHVNTVRYRLGRFEQITGGSLRNTVTLVEVWWALRVRSVRRPDEA